MRGDHDGALSQLGALIRAAMPVLLTMAVLLVLAAPIGLPGQPQLQWAIAFCTVFFWTVVRPWSYPPLAVFATGLVLDLLLTEPFGLAVLLLLLVQSAGLAWRPVLAARGTVDMLPACLAFAPVMAAAALLQWALVSLLMWQRMRLAPAVFEALLSVGFYPVLASLLMRRARRLHAEDLA